jgi:hypothetical protein
MANGKQQSLFSTEIQEPGTHGSSEAYSRQMNSASSPTETNGLRLSRIRLVPLGDLNPSPHNHVFEGLKTAEYYRDLKRDIQDTGTVVEPLVALRDGTLVSGHSRLKVARELFASGVERFKKIPVRYIQEDLTEEEVKTRVYQSNFSRFEIDQNTRILLQAEIYPDFFKPQTPSRKAIDANRPTASTIAANNGQSERQTLQIRKLYQRAKELAQQDRRSEPSWEDIQNARDELNGKRRKQKAKGGSARKPPDGASKGGNSESIDWSRYSTKPVSASRIKKTYQRYLEEHQDGRRRTAVVEFLRELLGPET